MTDERRRISRSMIDRSREGIVREVRLAARETRFTYRISA